MMTHDRLMKRWTVQEINNVHYVQDSRGMIVVLGDREECEYIMSLHNATLEEGDN